MPTDERIFDQLHTLERGARSGYHSGASYRNYNAGHVSYEAPALRYGERDEHAHRWQLYGHDLPDQPITSDWSDEQLLDQADYRSRLAEASLGRARMSIPPPSLHEPQRNLDFRMHDAHPYEESAGSRGPDLSHFALDRSQYGHATSSPFQGALSSSPTFFASQRRPPSARHTLANSSFSHKESTAFGQGPSFQPTGMYENESETRYQPPLQLHPPEYICEHSSNSIHPTKLSGRPPPVVQGINLVPTRELPDRLRSIFPYPLFNAVQSKSFDTIYNTNNNFVLSAPTGSGKTAVLELAVCRLINTFASDGYKIIYQAPTKSLCSERQRDWQAKFGSLGLQCAELTGDTDNAHLRHVQQAHIVITTPEKWDSMTRRWTDHQKLMQMVKLFLVDEVHILKEERGATLEAVVSRMKSVGSDVRFIALSATVPNSDDIAKWLGRDPMNPDTPASRERFGEEFRPVRLKKHVSGYQSNGNDFIFDKTLTNKLPEVITKFSHRKPIMVFCFTRPSCVETAKVLANWWATKWPQDRYWSAPRKRIVVADKDLRDTISSGVAFHHAGVSIQDRNAIEKAYLDGELSVICCTSTLAVGVNLPCHMVIIKNTISWQGSSGCKEYSDLEIMQMLGRAGRPQFDDSAIAVIMTRIKRVSHYEKMISGHEVLESCLHRNLIDHLNAEIGLGTITSASSAKKWLTGTFLFVRLKDNPDHYKLDGDASGGNLEERLEVICDKGIALLEENDLVTATPKLHCTEFGNAMSRYYVQFDTMKLIMALPTGARVSEILSTISQAAEFKDIRFRSGEKPIFKDLNKNNSIKFPIPVNLDLPAHKVSLIIQSVLGVIDLPTDDSKHILEYNTAKAAIFQHATRLIRCIVDCQLYLEDAVTTRNALMLARSFGAMVWDDSPLHMKQLDGLGPVYLRKLVNAGIMSIEDLETTEANRIEQAVSRNPPFGRDVQEKARLFPKLRVSMKMAGEPVIKKDEHVLVKIKAELGFLNEKVPETFQRRTVYVCLLAETSDGHKVHFARISAKKLSNGQDVLFSAQLTDSNQTIRAYVMCDGIAGSMRHAVLKPGVPAAAFPTRKTGVGTKQESAAARVAPNVAKKRSGPPAIDDEFDEFADPDLADADFMMAETRGYVDIDTFDDDGKRKQPSKKRRVEHTAVVDKRWEPQQLPNGKWVCNHKCSNKTACKHLCCREGTEKKPKPPKLKDSMKDTTEEVFDPKQTQLKLSTAKNSSSHMDPSPHPTQPAKSESREKMSTKPNPSMQVRDLNKLHDSVQMKTMSIWRSGPGKSSGTLHAPNSQGGQARMSFVEAARHADDDGTSDYGSIDWSSNDLPTVVNLVGKKAAGRGSADHDKLMGHTDDAETYREDEPIHDRNAFRHEEQAKRISYGDDFDDDDDEDNWNFDKIGVCESSYNQRIVVATRQDNGSMPGKEDVHLFVGYSTDSAGHDLAVNRPYQDLTAPDEADRVQQTIKHKPSQTAAIEDVNSVKDDIADWFKSAFDMEKFNLVP